MNKDIMKWNILRRVGVVVGNGDYDIKVMTSTGATAIIRNVFYFGSNWIDNYTGKDALCEGDIVTAYRKTSK